MANYGGVRIAAKSLLLLLLIVVLIVGGALWFDYLGVLDIKSLLAPVFNKLGLQGRTQPMTSGGVDLSLDDERMAVLVEALDLRTRELENQEKDMSARRAEIEQMAQELEERQKALDEREKSLNAAAAAADSKNSNIEQNARYLNGMPPTNAVEILLAMDDQLAIDVIRKTEEIAQAEGSTSIVSYWFSLMPADRAAELQRKMASRP